MAGGFGMAPAAAPNQPPPADIAALTLELLAARAADSSICPSEVARRLAPAPDWRALMPAVRGVARQLAQQGQLLVTQGERVLSPHEAWPGAIRLRRGPAWDGAPMAGTAHSSPITPHPEEDLPCAPSPPV